ncbi:MAG: TonB-dependent receptor plug domain-containing protein, partial [Bdellovibrionales bacterium]
MKLFYMLLLAFCLPSFPAENEDVERIQVTGSRIKRINIEGPSPLLILDKEDLEKSGYNSVADVLRDTNIVPFGLGRESSGSSTSGETFTGVHGAAALVLINGQRVITDPNAEAVDLHLIPIYAVERVEIIKDGSSAIYGSDALGGVINFIMKKNYSGKEAYFRVSPTAYPLYKGGHRVEGAAVWGNTYSKGSTTGVLQFRFNDSIVASDRIWSQTKISPTSIHPVFISDSGVATIADSCPPENKKEKTCYFNYAKYMETLPQISQISAYLQGNYKLSGVNFYSQILPSYKRTYYNFPPIPGTVNLPSGHKMSVQTGTPGRLINRFKEADHRIMTTHYLTLDTSFGATGYLSSTWDWNMSFKASGIYKKDEGANLLEKKTITDLIFEGTYDPFTTTQLDLTKALYTSYDNNSSTLFLADLVFSGNLGPLDTALGVNGYYTSYLENADPKVKSGDILSNTGSDGSGSRTVGSFFGEVTYSPFDSMEIQLAGRGDYYFDLNNSKNNSEDPGLFTFNPKLAFRFQPVTAFLLRGSVGTSFIAPSLHSLYGTRSEGYPFLIDSVACFNEIKSKGELGDLNENLVKDFISDQKETVEKQDLDSATKTNLTNLGKKLPELEFCKHRQYNASFSQNQQLKETKGISASVGSVFQINDNTSLTLDGWYIKTSGSPSYGVNDDTIKVELKKGKDFVAQHGITINRDETHSYQPILNSPVNGQSGIDSKLVNIASSELAGFDFSLMSRLPKNYFGGNFYFKEDGIIIFHSKSESFPGRGFKDNIGKSGLPRWKAISSLGW